MFSCSWHSRVVNLENLSDLQEGLLSEVGRENAEVFNYFFEEFHFNFHNSVWCLMLGFLFAQLKRIWEIPPEELDFERLIDRGAYGDVRKPLAQ